MSLRVAHRYAIATIKFRFARAEFYAFFARCFFKIDFKDCLVTSGVRKKIRSGRRPDDKKEQNAITNSKSQHDIVPEVIPVGAGPLAEMPAGSSECE